MIVGIVGLGRMGAAMAQRLREQDFEVIGWDHDEAASKRAAADGDYGSGDIAELPKFLREAMLQNFERRADHE